MPNNLKNVLLIGPGKMGLEYFKVLKAMEVCPIVIGRGHTSAENFESVTGVRVQRTDNIKDILDKLECIPKFAIIAVSVESLSNITMELLNLGVKNILVEKPAGINYEIIEKICNITEKKRANVFVAYNRRYYASTEKALEIIRNDGGVKSFNFEFTEWGEKIANTVNKRSDEYKEAWFILNSTHVVDLAFYLGGKPKELKSYVRGALPWHKKGAVYAGAGVTENEVLFSYQANWNAPGRWSVEVLTNQHRLYLKPMEELYIQEKNSVEIKKVNLNDSIDKEFKPGLYKEVETFLNEKEDGKRLFIQEHLENMKIYEEIEAPNK